MNRIKIIRVALGLSIVLFLASLTQKCYCTTLSCADSTMVLISGTVGFLFGGAALTWLANPLLVASWFSTKKPLLSLLFSSGALILSISFLFFNNIIVDEAGNYGQIISYRLGYWLWLSSNLVMFIGNVFGYFRYRNIEMV